MGKRLPAGLLQLAIVAAVMRLPLVVVAPVLNRIERDLHLSAATAGLLTTLPVLCFALFAVPSGMLLRRFGLRRPVAAALVVVAVGGVARVFGGAPELLAGTVLIGCALAVLNTAVVVMIAAQSKSLALATGVQIAACNVGSAVASAVVVPLSGTLGWRAATAMLCGLVALAAAVWIASYHDAVPARMPARAADPPRDRGVTAPIIVTMLLIVTFAGHTLLYYAVTSWAPSLLMHSAQVSSATAGAGASLFQGLGVVGSLLVTFFAARGSTRTALIAVTSIAWILLPAGLLIAPAGWLAWVVSAGLTQGGMFAAITLLMVAIPAPVATVTARVQAVGYAVAAVGPVALGALRDTSGGWTMPLYAMLAVSLLMAVAGVAVAALLAQPGSKHELAEAVR